MKRRPVEPLLPPVDHPAFEAAVIEMVERRQGAFCVYGHPGRGRSEKWKCLFETASREEAEAVFWRRVTNRPKSGLDRKATKLERVGFGAIIDVGIAGEDDGGIDSGSVVAASKARWEREQRQAQQKRVRVAPMIRVAIIPEHPWAEDTAAEAEAVDAEEHASEQARTLRIY